MEIDIINTKISNWYCFLSIKINSNVSLIHWYWKSMTIDWSLIYQSMTILTNCHWFINWISDDRFYQLARLGNCAGSLELGIRITGSGLCLSACLPVMSGSLTWNHLQGLQTRLDHQPLTGPERAAENEPTCKQTRTWMTPLGTIWCGTINSEYNDQANMYDLLVKRSNEDFVDGKSSDCSKTVSSEAVCIKNKKTGLWAGQPMTTLKRSIDRQMPISRAMPTMPKTQVYSPPWGSSPFREIAAYLRRRPDLASADREVPVCRPFCSKLARNGIDYLDSDRLRRADDLTDVTWQVKMADNEPEEVTPIYHEVSPVVVGEILCRSHRSCRIFGAVFFAHSTKGTCRIIGLERRAKCNMGMACHLFAVYSVIWRCPISTESFLPSVIIPPFPWRS